MLLDMQLATLVDLQGDVLISLERKARTHKILASTEYIFREIIARARVA